MTKMTFGGGTTGYFYGGLIAAQYHEQDAQTVSSYAAGKVENARKTGGEPGGVVGWQDDTYGPSTYSNVYWDADIGVRSPHKGAGNVRDQAGLTAFSDAQLKTGLPKGFDPKIWRQDANINGGYPYLLSNPPRR
jgi:hypothetical protein